MNAPPFDTQAVYSHYEVRVLGQAWQGFEAAHSVNVDPNNARFQRCMSRGDTVLESVKEAAQESLGDFAGITAYDIERVDSWNDSPQGFTGPDTRPVGESTTHTAHKRYTTLERFSDDDAATFDRCMHPEFYETDEVDA